MKNSDLMRIILQLTVARFARSVRYLEILPTHLISWKVVVNVDTGNYFYAS